MSKRLQKSLHDYLSKFKIRTPHVHIPKRISSKRITNSTNWVLSGCKHPKTPSFDIDEQATHGREKGAATLSDIDQFLFENFSSLYCYDNNSDGDEEDEKERKQEQDNDQKSNGFLFDSPRLNIDVVPEIRSSNRFFVSPGTSSSLVEEARSSASTLEELQSITHTASSSTSLDFKGSIRSSTEIKGVSLPDESIAVLTYSPDPCSDFRQSMEEMIEARLNQNQSIDWDFMEELLFCYLKLNDKKSYKYILGAFVDLTVSLRQSNDKTPAKEHQIPTKGERRRRNRDVT
ncbi:hypothetical protein IFM89_004255 [Coptis chinensis]|uniref:Transcription repressor n=1 Tax=Coptis chinensis TaxID=261450 RepID=A0A835I5A9_9MAGN|nr:hypothetical protein IFM89_004255 [Coptis chinensis]